MAVDDLIGFNELLGLGDDHIKNSYGIQKEEDIEEADYREKEAVPIARDVDTGEIIWIPYDKRTFLFLCAKTREGKTVLAKNYISRIVELGGSAFVGSDIKDDFQSFDYKGGVSDRIRNETQGLLKSEKPKLERIDFKEDFAKNLAIPYFLKDYYSDDDPNPRNIGQLFSLSFSDISKNDFKNLIGIDSWTSETQKEIMEDILSTVEMDELTWEYLFRRIENETGGRSVDKLMRKLEKYKNDNVLGSKGSSLDSLINFQDENLFSLGLLGIDEAEDNRVDFYSALAHRRFFDACKGDDVSKPRVLLNDEAHEVLPASRSTLTKDEVAKLFSRRAGQLGIATVLSTQEPRKIPSVNDRSPHDFVKNTTHAFVGRGLNWKGYKTIFRVFRFYDQNNTQPLQDLVNELEQYQFLYIDQSMKNVDDVKIVEALAPLCAHPET